MAATRPPALVRHLMLHAGFIVIALGSALGLRAHLGLTPWDVFHLGVSKHTPLTIGEASIITGLVVLLGGMLLGVRPGIGTVLNMLLIGFWLDRILGLGVLPDLAGGHLAVRLLMVAASIVCFGVGSGAYIGADLGAGPRDSFMLAVCRRRGWSVVRVRNGMEMTACAAGFVLGGVVGIGTVASVVLLGAATHWALRLFGYDVHPSATAEELEVLPEAI